MDETIIFAFIITLIAGLSTGIGSAIAFFCRKTNFKFLSVALGFSAGVMIYVSFIEILPKAIEISGEIISVISFFCGVLIMAIIDFLVPSFENPHELHSIEDMEDKDKAKRYRKLHRLGLFTALAIAIHNFPEGMVTFVSAITDPGLGISIAVAIAIHNIPEGIAVSVPIYYATNSRKKAFIWSFLSGLAEPLGAFVAYLLLMKFISSSFLGILFASVAGIMMYISFDELLPTAREYGKPHYSIFGLFLGMLVMAVSLLLFL